MCKPDGIDKTYFYNVSFNRPIVTVCLLKIFGKCSSWCFYMPLKIFQKERWVKEKLMKRTHLSKNLQMLEKRTQVKAIEVLD